MSWYNEFYVHEYDDGTFSIYRMTPGKHGMRALFSQWVVIDQDETGWIYHRAGATRFQTQNEVALALLMLEESATDEHP